MNAMDAYASDALLHYKRFTSPNSVRSPRLLLHGHQGALPMFTSLQIRQFLVVCLNPGLASDDYQPIVGKVYRCLDRLSHSLQKTFVTWLQACVDRFPSLPRMFSGSSLGACFRRLPAALLRQCVETVQWHINRLLKTHSSVFEIEPPVVVLGFFREHWGGCVPCCVRHQVLPPKLVCADEANEAVFGATGHRTLPYDAFYNHKVSAEINLRDDFERWAALKYARCTVVVGCLADVFCVPRVDATGRPLFSFCAHPFILDSAAKAQILRFEASRQMAMSRGSGFMAMMQPNFPLKVHRDRILEDALDQIVHVGDKADLKKELVVKFVGEAGIDQGGVKKEFFQILTRRMFDPEYGTAVAQSPVCMRLFSAQVNIKRCWWQACL